MNGPVLDAGRLELLRELTRRHETFLVWKHLDRALLGRGDIDAATPRADVDSVRATCLELGRNVLAATTVIECRHVADKTLLFFIQPERLPQLFELDLCHQPSRGLAPWAEPPAMLSLACVDRLGVRRLRPGAEAVVSLVYHGLSRSGRARLNGDEEDIFRRGIRDDLAAANDACRAFAPYEARRYLLELVACGHQGGWHPRASRLAWAAMVASGWRHPFFVARRGLFRARLVSGRECVMSDLARRHGRAVEVEQLGSLLDRALREGHGVHTL